MAHQLARPTVTRRRFGSGIARYVTTVGDPASTTRLLRELCAEAGVRGSRIGPAGVEAVGRRHADASAFTGQVRVPAGGVVVVRESPAAPNHGQE